MRRFAAVVVSCLLSSGLQAVSAADLANNLGESRSGSSGVSDSFWFAQAFSTTLTDNVITSVTLAAHKSAVNTSGTLNVSVYTNSGSNTPGTLVATLASLNVATQLTTTIGDQVTIGSLNTSLATSTTYYLVLSGSGITGGLASWDFTNSTSGTGFPSNATLSSTSGTSWAAPILTDPQIMRIVAVPEPSTYALGAICAGTLSYLGRRKRHGMS